MLTLLMDGLIVKNNNLESGCILKTLMNVNNFTIVNSQFKNNTAQISNVEPSSSDLLAPMIMYFKECTFIGNYGKRNALLKITTNSILNIYSSSFLENYSTDRGSILLADYQKSSANIYNSSFINNYAYLGGVFYAQYSSTITVTNCLMY